MQAIRSSVTWGKTAYPGYGVSIEKAAKPLTLEAKLAQAERVPTYRTELTPRLGLVEGKPEYTFTSWSVPTGKETLFTQRAALEFQQSLQRMISTRYYIPTTTGKTFQPFKGTPSTPFEQSLSKAFATPEKVVSGGRQFVVSELAVKPATYTIAERVMKDLGLDKTKTVTTGITKLVEPIGTQALATKVTRKTVQTVLKGLTVIPHPFLWKGGEYPSKYAMEKTLLSQRFEVYPTTKTIFKPFPKLKEKEKKALQKAGFTVFVGTLEKQVVQQRERQKQRQGEIQRLRQSQTLTLKQMQSLVQSQAQIQVLRQEQALKLRRIQLSVTAQIQTPFLAHPPYTPRIVPTPTPTPPPPPPPIITPPYTPLEITGLQRRSKRGPRFGAWFYRRHPIAKAETVAKLAIGQPRRRTKRKAGLQGFNQIRRVMRGSARRRLRKRRNSLEDLARKLKAVI